MGSVYKPTRMKDGKRVKYQTYRIAYTDASGRRVTEKAYRDKSASEALLRKREQEVERRKAGLLVVDTAHLQRPLAELQSEWEAELVRRGSPAEGSHVKDARKILGAIRTACKWKTLGDVRRDEFRAYLGRLAKVGRAPRTQNHHLAHLRNFLNWTVEQGWLQRSPLEGMRPVTVGQAGKRHVRRALSEAELQALLAATPEPRRTVYLVAALSGYRRSELRRMTKADLSPEGDRPRWHLAAASDKTGTIWENPMVPDLQAVLLPLWRKAKGPLFPRIPIMRTFHKDCARARIARKDDRGRVLDFHSLRYTFCRLMAARFPLQTVQRLMRHRTVALTADLYGALGLEDIGGSVWTLPPILLSQPASSEAKDGANKERLEIPDPEGPATQGG